VVGSVLVALAVLPVAGQTSSIAGISGTCRYVALLWPCVWGAEVQEHGCRYEKKG
jgi:hypothetical protein